MPPKTLSHCIEPMGISVLQHHGSHSSQRLPCSLYIVIHEWGKKLFHICAIIATQHKIAKKAANPDRIIAQYHST